MNHPEKRPAGVLIAEDEPASRQLLGAILNQAGYWVKMVGDGEAIRSNLDANTDIVILDLRLPKSNGLQSLQWIKQRSPTCEVIVVSSSGIEDAVMVMEHGAFTFIQKPIHRERLLLAAQSAVKRRRNNLQSERDPLRELSSLFFTGISPELRALENSCNAIQSRQENAIHLISNHSFSAELAARHIFHSDSKRFTGRFVVLQDSVEITRKGESFVFYGGEIIPLRDAIERAREGIIFVPNFFERGSRFQDVLFQCISNQGTPSQEFREGPRGNCMLIISGSESSIANGKLPLHFASIRIPPLVDRKSDLPFIAESSLKYMSNPDEDFFPPSLHPDVFERLSQYSWPGDFEELISVLHSFTSWSCGAPLSGDHILFQWNKKKVEKRGSSGEGIIPLSLHEGERQTLILALENTGGHQGQAARVLGISERTLYNKLKKHNLLRTSI